jgi:hypothetical protein
MNAQLAILPPLPAALQSPMWASPYRPARRRSIGHFPIRAEALARFNRLLARLQHFPLDRDQLVTASRELAGRSPSAPCPASIAQRLRLADTVERMINDATWQPASEVIAPARLVVDYVHGAHELIPEQVPRIGHLDDAILLDAAWPKLAGEVDSYRDYCRLRKIEARLRGCQVGEFSFSRKDWEQARCAEAGLFAHCRRVGSSSYLPADATARFRVY